MQIKSNVKMWEETITIPTYEVSPPEKSPLFIEKRAYQGSTGKVYPLPVTEKIADVKKDKRYHAVFLENDYLQVMILPELGGRIQRALDKTNQYDFVYYNHVIKPALVGLTGPWISGGIEFNWPQHHRPSTFSPVDYKLVENPDGSCTVWVSEIDKMYGTKGMAGFTLYPDKAYIEITGQLYNRTDLPQTFLWWANPAVPVNDKTYSVFPPDVHAVMDHGKRAVSTFPIATGEYYKYDYSEGIDISRYANVKVPTSYMAYQSNFDFIGNYDEGVQAGLLHVADHHISPGKKQWTWGNSDFGVAWDRNLTDTDGPYIELMTGVFADNQPDFTWLKPYEEKTFTQYFFPYKGVGRVKNATCDALVNFTVEEGTAAICVYATSTYENARIIVKKADEVIFETSETLSPFKPYQTTLKTHLISAAGCSVIVYDIHKNILVQYDAIEKALKPTPDPAQPLNAPEELRSTEELYLAATHLEQYRHATYEPADYYLEGLRRDGTDIRLNNGYGLLLYKRGNFTESISYFKKAIEKQTWKNPNPYQGETYFNLGLALNAVHLEEDAFDAFYKATWSYEIQCAGFFWLSCLSAKKKNYKEALEFIDKSLVHNWHNMKARTLKAALLRIMQKDNLAFINESLQIDPLDLGCIYEQGLSTKNLSPWKEIMRTPVHNYLELAVDYMKCGLYDDVLAILEACDDQHPLVYYYQSYIYSLISETDKALELCKMAEAACPDYCFPNRLEEILILENAAKLYDEASFAHYYLGNLLYDKKQYEKAITHWEIAASKNEIFPITFRNLAIAYFNKRGDRLKAFDFMKKAYALEPTYSRFLLEYIQLAGKVGMSNEERLALLENNLEATRDRDVLYLEYITLLNNTGYYDKALACLLSHTFHPWEGGEGKVSGQYRYALTQKAIAAIKTGAFEEALNLLTRTLTYPDNLGEGKLPNAQDNAAYYYMGIAYRALGNHDTSTQYFKKASVGLSEPSSMLYYNDPCSDTIFYQGLASEALNNLADAKKCYHQLIAYGEKHLFDQVGYDYFAVSLPEMEVFQDSIWERNTHYCNYLIALGKLGLGDTHEAQHILKKILDKNPSYQGALQHLNDIVSL
ncbi:DUF5107 domain-containing protein [Cellulosilyticum sp. I15G10I2]|uniref:DUF5107 domain-containing protein n=1 Tax=Cellulosilyticum sp. I15G10I2 TaxID=1892843 RepID=UPI00085C9929|nr:DUF5107 domain-containing protein [Cellulosilyticum sp. I15G10I2]